MMMISLDTSTKFVAYAIWYDDKLFGYGKIYPSGKGDAAIASMSSGIMREFTRLQAVDKVVYESAYMGTNANVLKQLSKTIGSVIGGFYMLGVRDFVAVPPITWQTGIGVGKTSAKDKQWLRAKYPGKGVTWLRNKDRDNRKQKIIDFVNQTYDKDFEMQDNDIADAIALGHYYNKVRGI